MTQTLSPADPKEQAPPFPAEEFPDDMAYLHSLSPDIPYQRGLIEEKLADLNSLAGDLGCGALTLEAIYPPSREDMPDLKSAPDGLSSETVVEDGAKVSIKALREKIRSFRGEVADTETVDVSILQTDSENPRTIRLVDLRPLMTGQVRKQGPVGKAKPRLDRAVYNGTRILAEGGNLNSVRIAPGVLYVKSTRSGTMDRSYLAVVEDENAPDGQLTVARLADCSGNDEQEDLYRRVFGEEMGKK